MTTQLTHAIPHPHSLVPSSLLRRLYHDEPVMTAMGVLLVLSMVPTALAMTLDARLFNGVNVWDKPLKFEMALAVYTLTLAFFARFVPRETREGRGYRIFTLVVAFCIVGEMVWIGGAAANATASHFNNTNTVMMAIYGLMGAFAVTLTSATLVYGIAIRRNPATGLSPGMHRAIWTSLVATFVLTLISAGYMSGNPTGHWVGGTQSDATGSFFFDWSRDGGDLRVAHFFATHAFHAVPLAMFAALQAGLKPGKRAADLMVVAYSAIVLLAFAQAVMGQPFLPGWL